MLDARRVGLPAVLCLLSLSALAGAGSGRLYAADPPERIVAVGDVHGDATTFRAILQHAGVIDEQGRWTGGRATLVQTGDYFDRGSEVRAALDLLMAIESEAAAGGGRAIALFGNHEGMNLIGELRDVSPEAYGAFADAQSDNRRQKAFDAHVKLAEARRAALARQDPPQQPPAIYAAPDRTAWMEAHPPGLIEYLEAIAPSGRYGAWLRKRSATIRIGRTAFVHGGFDPELAPKSLDDVNTQVAREIQRFDRMRQYMIDRKLALPSFTFQELLDAGRAELIRVAAEARARGEVSPGPGVLPPAVVRHPLAGLLDIDQWALLNARGPLWFRGFAEWTDAQGSAAVATLAQRFDADRFVVGHSVTRAHEIQPRFDNRVFLIDTGLSSVYRREGGQPSALEITGETITAVYTTGRVQLVPATASR